MPDNTYVLVAARMTDEDLLEALAHHEKYVDDMLTAMLDVAEKRGLTVLNAEALRAEIASRIEPEEILQAIDEERPIPIELPELYSQTAILAFSIFFSPAFGGILFAMNMKRMQKKNGWLVVLLSFAVSAISGYVTWYYAKGTFLGILIPIACGLLLSEILWSRIFGKHQPYKHRRVIIPLVIALAIAIPLSYYMYEHPEQFGPQTTQHD